MQVELVQNACVNHDSNLLDVTVATLIAQLPSTTHSATSKQQSANVAAYDSQGSPETLHTTTEHPFLTTDRDWVDAQVLRVGERVQRLDGLRLATSWQVRLPDIPAA